MTNEKYVEMLNELLRTPEENRELLRDWYLGKFVKHDPDMTPSDVRKEVKRVETQLEKDIASAPRYAPPGTDEKTRAALNLENALTGQRPLEQHPADRSSASQEQDKPKTKYQTAAEQFENAFWAPQVDQAEQRMIGLDKDGRRVVVDTAGKISSVKRARINLERGLKGLPPLSDEDE